MYYIPKLLKNYKLVDAALQQIVFSFLIDDNQQPDTKDTKNENEKCSKHGGLNDGGNSAFCYYCNTNHHAMMFPFLILRGLLRRTHTFFWALSLCERCWISISFFCYAVQVCLKYILFKFHFTCVLCKPLHSLVEKAGPLYEICGFFKVSFNHSWIITCILWYRQFTPSMSDFSPLHFSESNYTRAKCEPLRSSTLNKDKNNSLNKGHSKQLSGLVREEEPRRYLVKENAKLFNDSARHSRNLTRCARHYTQPMVLGGVLCTCITTFP